MAAKATGYLELNIAGFDQALKTAKNLMATFAAGFAGYKLGTVFKDGIKDAIDFGKSMNTVSRSMGGLGAGNLLLVQKALERTGQGAEEAQGHIADFVKSGRSISSMFGGADNYAAALSKSSKEYGDQADVLNRSAAKLQTIWNSIEVVVSKARTFFLAMTEQFILPLQLALEKLKSINVADFGERFGKAISDASLLLYGIFKNGDITETLRLGVTLAFQEGVNYLVGGVKFVAEYIEKNMYNSLVYAYQTSVDFFVNLWDTVVSSKIAQGIFYGAVSAWAKAMEYYYQGIAELTEHIRASFIYGIISAFSKAYSIAIAPFSVDFWVKMWDGAKSLASKLMDLMLTVFRNSLEFLTNGIPSAFVKAAGIMKSMLGNFGGGLPSDLSYDSIKNSSLVKADSIRGVSGFFGGIGASTGDKSREGLDILKGTFSAAMNNVATSYAKGSIFDTGKDQSRLQEIIANGFKVGTEAAGKAQIDNTSAPTKGVLTSFSGASSKVIADSLAKVGGGGNFLRVGMTLSERTALDQLRAQRESNEIQKTIAKNTAADKKPATMK